jgi:hypothetical protein
MGITFTVDERACAFKIILWALFILNRGRTYAIQIESSRGEKYYLLVWRFPLFHFGHELLYSIFAAGNG